MEDFHTNLPKNYPKSLKKHYVYKVSELHFPNLLISPKPLWKPWYLNTPGARSAPENFRFWTPSWKEKSFLKGSFKNYFFMYLGARSDDNRKNKIIRNREFSKSKNAQNQLYIPLAGVDNKRNECYLVPDCTQNQLFPRENHHPQHT